MVNPKNFETKKVLDMMYESWITYSGQQNNQRKHPSREVYAEILNHAQIWKMTAEAVLEQVEQKDGGEIAGNQ